MSLAWRTVRNLLTLSIEIPSCLPQDAFVSAFIATSLAAVSGWFTGILVARIVYKSPKVRYLYGLATLCAAGAVLTLWCFVYMDTILRFGDNPSFGFNLLFTIGMEGVALGGSWIGARLQNIRWPENVDEFIDSDATPNPARMWILGFGVPFLLVYVGVNTALQRKAVVGTILWHLEVNGLPAIAYGSAAAAVGMFLHFHFLWSAEPALQPYSKLGKQLSLMIGCLGLMYASLASIG